MQLGVAADFIGLKSITLDVWAGGWWHHLNVCWLLSSPPANFSNNSISPEIGAGWALFVRSGLSSGVMVSLYFELA